MVLWHLEVENQKPADIAPLLGMSANSVSALAYRAREGLRQAFLNMHSGDLVSDACRETNDLHRRLRPAAPSRAATRPRSRTTSTTAVGAPPSTSSCAEVNSSLAATARSGAARWGGCCLPRRRSRRRRRRSAPERWRSSAGAGTRPRQPARLRSHGRRGRRRRRDRRSPSSTGARARSRRRGTAAAGSASCPRSTPSPNSEPDRPTRPGIATSPGQDHAAERGRPPAHGCNPVATALGASPPTTEQRTWCDESAGTRARTRADGRVDPPARSGPGGRPATARRPGAGPTEPPRRHRSPTRSRSRPSRPTPPTPANPDPTRPRPTRHHRPGADVGVHASVSSYGRARPRCGSGSRVTGVPRGHQRQAHRERPAPATSTTVTGALAHRSGHGYICIATPRRTPCSCFDATRTAGPRCTFRVTVAAPAGYTDP